MNHVGRCGIGSVWSWDRLWAPHVCEYASNRNRETNLFEFLELHDFLGGFKGTGVFGILVIFWCWWGVDSIIWGKLPCEIVRLYEIVLVWLLCFWCFWGWGWWRLLFLPGMSCWGLLSCFSHVLEFVKPDIGDLYYSGMFHIQLSRSVGVLILNAYLLVADTDRFCHH